VLLQWTAALSVGDELIDAQHQELFRRVDRLLDAMARNDRSEAVRLLEFMIEYVDAHFSAEERLMADTGFPDATRHIQEHRAFRQEIEALDADFLVEGPTGRLVLRLEALTVGWLKEHVYFTDVSLGRWLSTQRPAILAHPA
jgi:hemerythrin